jgi:GNAT superfamily N-acetyltransferase
MLNYNFITLTKDLFLQREPYQYEDSFAKTFVAKANARNLWGAYDCVGIVDDCQKLLGGCITTISKREPVCANLQLIHVFHDSRNLGVGKKLVMQSIDYAVSVGAQYFRLSAEFEAIAFYEKLGFKFYGKQKSGTVLSIGKFVSVGDSTLTFSFDDTYIYNKLMSNIRGSLVEVFDEFK